MAARSRARRQGGQAAVEFALVVPVIILLILGAYDASIMASNKGIATAAVRHGARLGSELGGIGTGVSCKGTVPSGTSDSKIDDAIINDVLAAAFEIKDKNGQHFAGMYYADVSEVDIYRVTSASNGVFVPGTNHANEYTIAVKINAMANTSWTITPKVYAPAYPLSERCQAPLTQLAEIGVHMTWTYHPANKIPAPNVSFDDYAVQTENLCNNNCL